MKKECSTCKSTLDKAREMLWGFSSFDVRPNEVAELANLYEQAIKELEDKIEDEAWKDL